MSKDQRLKDLILAAKSGSEEDFKNLRNYLDLQYAFSSVGANDRTGVQHKDKSDHTIHNQDKTTGEALQHWPHGR